MSAWLHATPDRLQIPNERARRGSDMSQPVFPAQFPNAPHSEKTLLNNDALKQEAHRHSPSAERPPPPPVSALHIHHVGNSTVVP